MIDKLLQHYDQQVAQKPSKEVLAEMLKQRAMANSGRNRAYQATLTKKP